MQKILLVGLVLGLSNMVLGPVAAQGTAEQRRKATSIHKSQTGPRPSAVQPPPALEAEELRMAEQVHTGTLPCELGKTVSLVPDHRAPGYFRVQGPGFRYHMRPVSSRTGVIRLEDHQAGAVWLQLADKSMLMDQKKGRRLADACAHPQQLTAAAEMKNNPPQPLFETEAAGRND